MADSIFLEGTDCECDVSLDTWLKDALALTPGIQRGMAARMLVLTCREFFERTLAWRVRIPNINAKAGNKQYWLSPYDEFSNVISVIAVVWKKDGDAEAARFLSVLPMQPAADSTTDSPQSYYVDPSHPDSFYLYPALENDVDDAIDVVVALTPKQSVEHLPRIAALKFYDAILEGFLARVLMHPATPYGDPAKAQLHRRNFLTWCGRYMADVKRGYAGAQNWSYPGGWGVRHIGKRG